MVPMCRSLPRLNRNEVSGGGIDGEGIISRAAIGSGIVENVPQVTAVASGGDDGAEIWGACY